MGVSSLPEKDQKEQKDIKAKSAIEQFNYKFPENEKHFGFENVSIINLIILIFIKGFKRVLY